MASILHLLLAQCLCFLVHPVPSAATKLLAPRVLLPYYQDLTIKYVLAAEEGCYMWSTSRPDVVTVFPIPEKNSLCSQRVVLLAHSNQPKRLNSLVIAEEKVTGRLLRCDVIVDVIHSLEIMTRSRELYVEDLPLELTVRALDKEGNTFSTLAGIHFEWVVVDENTGDVEPSSRLRIVPYWSTEYYPPEYISTLERDGQQGDMILVSGIHTGPSVIKVGIQGDHYKLIPAASVRLQVFENILLTPNSDIFLLVGTEAQFRVQKLVQGKSTEIPLPLQNYEVRLEQQDESKMPVASLDAMSITVTALQLGSATLVLTHKNLHMLGSSSITNCTLHVVEPGFLGFFILPRNRSVLEEKTVYEVSTEVYTKDSSMRVYPSQNLWIDFSFPKEFFIPLFSSENGSYHVVQANQTGTTIINATLMGVKARGKTLQKLLVPLSHNQEVQIFQQIVLKPKVLTFPNYPPGVPYHYPMQVEGGSGSFTWVCINQSVATITMKGILIITTVTGHSQIQARDVLNPFHWGESQVHVLPVSALEMHPVQAATQVGKEIHVPVMMFANAMHLKVPFTDCSLLPLQISIDKEGVFVVLEGNCTSEPPSCACLVLLAQAPGHILLTVRANTNYGSFHSEVTLSAYEPLKVLVILANKLILIFGPECYLTNTPGSADSYLFVATNPTGSVLKGSWSSTQMEVIKTMLNTPDSVICSVSFSDPSLYITASSVFHAQPVFNVETELLKELDIASKLMVFLFSFFTGLAFASMIYLGYIALVDHMRSAPVVYLLSADASPQNTSYRTISLGRYNTKPRLWSTK